MAQKHIGAKNVCEAAAILGANQGRLIVPKQKSTNATLAVAAIASTLSASDPAPPSISP
jgi:cobalt-precorrin 5A hydrolase